MSWRLSATSSVLSDILEEFMNPYSLIFFLSMASIFASKFNLACRRSWLHSFLADRYLAFAWKLDGFFFSPRRELTRVSAFSADISSLRSASEIFKDNHWVLMLIDVDIHHQLTQQSRHLGSIHQIIQGQPLNLLLKIPLAWITAFMSEWWAWHF